MQEMLKNECTKLLSIRTGDELYRIYFRANQVVAVLAILFQICLLPVMLGSLAYTDGAVIALPLMFSGVLILGLTVVMLEYGLRCVERGQFRGIVIGLIMALWSIPSYWFLLGFFGLYAFLNVEFQKAKLMTAPPAFLDFLTAIRMNFSGQAQDNATQLQR